jgi:hypothetical protein
MKKWFTIHSIPLLVGLTLVISCKEQPDPPTYYIPEGYMPYISFLPGSYWVYEDSVSGALDSVVVVDYKLETTPFEIEDEILNYNQSLFVQTYSHFSSKLINTQTIQNCVHPDGIQTCYETSRYLASAGDVGFTDILSYPFKQGIIFSGPSSVESIFSSWVSDSVTFNHVVVSLCPEDPIFDGGSSRYFIAEGIGIIRIEGNPPTGVHRVWKMLRYHAVR